MGNVIVFISTIVTKLLSEHRISVLSMIPLSLASTSADQSSLSIEVTQPSVPRATGPLMGLAVLSYCTFLLILPQNMEVLGSTQVIL